MSIKAPDKIYVAESDKIVGHIGHRIFSESSFQRNSSVEYIRKDALLEWANKELKRYSEDTQWEFGYSRALRDLIDKLNQL